MILLEGQDCVGKSTVARKLMQYMSGWSYRHHTKPPVDSFNYFGWFMADAHQRLVVDRLHWSEVTYAHVYRHGSSLTRHQWRYLELMALSRNSVVVHLWDNIDNVKLRWGKVNQEMFDFGPQRELLTDYVQLVGDQFPGYISNLPRIVCKLDDLVLDSAPTIKLQSIIAAQRTLTRMDIPPPSVGLGRVAPGGFVILGEGLSPNIFTETSFPRLPWDFGKSPKLLWDTLDAGNVQWDCGYYTNITGFETPADLRRILETIKPNRVITLGGEAKRFAQAANEQALGFKVPIYPLSHPAYVLRFKTDQIQDWQSELLTALQPYRANYPDWCPRFGFYGAPNVRAYQS